ncbi:MAG: RdgB/HAM1 family non-canonical purine NTP pyrophosphatase [Patescibacteria group bacterium]|jgi:XTP/dITP diphosphohydrolase
MEKFKNIFLPKNPERLAKIKLIFASQNKGKLREIKKILADLKIDIASAREAGITKDIKETGKTFEENAFKKAKIICQKTKAWVIAEDSGLCIKALAGKPGVKTARWAGPDATDEMLVQYTLNKLKNIPQNRRQAYFQTAAVLISPAGKYWIFNGRTDGEISLIPKGKNRVKLPYDRIFIPQGYTKTFAQMSDRQKNELSHRGRAFSKLKKFLKNKVS